MQQSCLLWLLLTNASSVVLAWLFVRASYEQEQKILRMKSYFIPSYVASFFSFKTYSIVHTQKN